MTQAKTLEVGEQSTAKDDVEKKPSSQPKPAETPAATSTLPGSGSLTPHETETAAIIDQLRGDSEQSHHSIKSGQGAKSGVEPETKVKKEEKAPSEAGSYAYSDAFDPITPGQSFVKSRDESFVTSVASGKTKEKRDSSASSASSKSSRSSHSSKSSKSSHSSKSSKSSHSSKSSKSSHSSKSSKSSKSSRSSRSSKSSDSSRSRKSSKSPKRSQSPKSRNESKTPKSKTNQDHSKIKSPITDMMSPDVEEKAQVVSTTKKSSATPEIKEQSAHPKDARSESGIMTPDSKDEADLVRATSPDTKKHSAHSKGDKDKEQKLTIEGSHLEPIDKNLPKLDVKKLGDEKESEASGKAAEGKASVPDVSATESKQASSGAEIKASTEAPTDAPVDASKSLTKPITPKEDKSKVTQSIEKEIEQKIQSPIIERSKSVKSDAGSRAGSQKSSKKPDHDGSEKDKGTKSVTDKAEAEVKKVFEAETEVSKDTVKSADQHILTKNESKKGSPTGDKSRASNLSRESTRSDKSAGANKSEKDHSSDSATPRPQSLGSRASSRTLTPRGSRQSKPCSRISDKSKSRQDGEVALDLKLKTPNTRASSGHSSVISPLKPMKSPQKGFSGSSEGKSSAGGRQPLESRASEKSSRRTHSRGSITSTVSARSLKSKTEYVEERKYLKSLQGDNSDYDIDLSTHSLHLSTHSLHSKTTTPPPKSRVSATKSKTSKLSTAANDDTSSSELEYGMEYDKRKSPGSQLSVRSKSRSKPMGMVGFELQEDVKACTSDSSENEKVSAAVGKLSISKPSKSPEKRLSRPTSSASNKSRIMSAREYAKLSSKASSQVSSRQVSAEPEKEQLSSDSSDHYSDIFSSDDGAKSKKSAKKVSGISSDASSATEKGDKSEKSMKSARSRTSKSSRASSRSSHSAAEKSIEDEFLALEESILPDAKVEKAEMHKKDEADSSSDDSLFEAAKDVSSSESDAAKSRASSHSGKLSEVSKKVSRTSSHSLSLASVIKSQVSSMSSKHSSRASSARSKTIKSLERESSQEMSRRSSRASSRASSVASHVSKESSKRSFSADSSKASSRRSREASKRDAYSSSDSEFEAAAARSDSHSSSESDASVSSHASKSSAHSASSKGKSVSPVSSKHSIKSKSSYASSKHSLSDRSSRSSKHSLSRASSTHSAHKEASYHSDAESEKMVSRVLTRSGLSHESGDERYSDEEAATVPPLPPIDDKPITAAREDVLPAVTIRKRPKMSRESTSIRALQIISQKLKQDRSKKPSAKFAASLGPYRATDHVFEFINQPERATTGVIRSRPTVLELVGLTGPGGLNTTEFGIEREVTAATISGIRPKVIPITGPLPPFPRLGAVVNYRSKVRGKLDYNSVPQARAIIEYERKKRQEYRTQAEYEITRKSWARFQLNRIPSNNSTNHFLRAANSYFQSTGSYRAMRESVPT